MGGYFSRGDQGTTELRIHGVSGTPPTAMLDHPDVRRVAGDRVAGFYRRWWPVPPGAANPFDGDSAYERQEAYSWGGLTAASRWRALWVLLLPFLLANVAFFMVPSATTEGGEGWRRRVRRSSEAMQRVLSLGLTCLLVLSSVSVAMDVVAWQCTREGTNCAGNVAWLGFLTRGFFEQPGRRLAAAALVPLATILLLWWLSRTTWSSYEDRRPPPRAGGAGVGGFALERRRLWNGRGPVRRLRNLHVTAGLALVGVQLVAPIATGGVLTALLRPILAALLVLLVASLLLVFLRVTAARTEPAVEDEAARAADGGRAAPPAADQDLEQKLPWLDWVYHLMPVLTLVLVVVAGVVALLPGVGPGETSPVNGSRVLPWFGFLFLAVMVLLAGTWLLVAVLTAVLAVATRTRPDGRRGQAQADTQRLGDLPEVRAWFGLGTPVALMLAWLVGGSFAAGVSLLVAGWLGDPVPAGATSGAVPLTLPSFYFWTAVAEIGILLLLVLGLAAGSVELVLRYRRLYREEVPNAYPRHLQAGAEVDRRTRARRRKIALAWALAGGVELGRTAVGRIIVPASVLLYAGLGLLLVPSMSSLFEQVPGWLLVTSVTLITTATLGLVGLGRAAYRDPGKRRRLGILWDVGTFWPRATHPLAPPSYGERVIPDLITRVGHLTPTPDDEVILSAHSQGAIIAAALVLQLDDEQRRRVCLLSYGCPLRRLYSLFFPGYFDLTTIRHLGALLGPAGAEPARWAWRNLHRPSDPIGGPVLTVRPAVERRPKEDPLAGDHDEVDRQLVDPAFAPPPGDLSPPATLGHSHYFADAAFSASRMKVLELHRQRRAPVAGPADPAELHA